MTATGVELEQQLPVPNKMDVSPRSALKSATMARKLTESPVISAKWKRSTSKDVFETIEYDESLVGTTVKVWWPEDIMYYKGLVAEFYPDRKKHKVSYVDGDEEILDLRTEKWKILKKFSVRDDEEQNPEEIEKDNDVKESENENGNVKDADVKESENQNEKDNHVVESVNEAVTPSVTEKDKDTIQKFSAKAVESKHAATANVSSPSQSDISVLDESSVRSNKKKPVPQEVETASPSKSGSPPDETCVKEMDVSPKSALISASREGISIETPVNCAKRKHSASKDEVSHTLKYDESLVGTKVEVWWPEDEMYYEGVVTEFYPDRMTHKVSYVDGSEETLNLRTQKWKIMKELSVRNDEEQNTEVQGEKGSPDIHKNKIAKTDPAASQEKIKDSSKKIGGVSSSGKSKALTPTGDNSPQKTSGKSCDAAATTSKAAAKSKEDEETLKTVCRKKTVNKSKGKTPPSSSKSNTNGPTNAEKMEYAKEIEGKKLRLEDKRLRLEAEKLRIKAEKVQSKICQEDERLRLEAEKLKLLKRESDLLTMMMDVSGMPEMQRLYFEELQREIVMRRRSP